MKTNIEITQEAIKAAQMVNRYVLDNQPSITRQNDRDLR